MSLSEVEDFQQCIDTCGLNDIQLSGCKYTWSDKQANRIFLKIDWVFVNGDWINQLPLMVSHALQEGVSGHCLIMIITPQVDRMKKRAFTYCNMWSSHSSYVRVVRDCWETQISGCYMFQIVKKLKKQKQKLRTLHKQNFSNIEEAVKINRGKLQCLQAQLQLTPLDINLQQEEKCMAVEF